MSVVNLSFPEPPDFAYDSQRPTFYSEYYAYCLHKHQAALSAAGASVHIENASHADQISAMSSFANNLQAWSEGSVNALVQYLTGGDDAVEPVFPDFPIVPELLESAVSLLPGGKLALIVKGAVPFIKGFLMLKEKLRPTDPVRILDKALLKSSWFVPGVRKSWLEEISEKLPDVVDGAIPVSTDFSSLVDVFSAQDCNNTQTSIAQILFRALGECREVGEEEFAYYGLFDALQGILSALSVSGCNDKQASIAQILFRALGECRDVDGGDSAYYGIYELLQQLIGVLSAMSVEVETEKAARVRLSGIDAAAEIPFPSNL